MSNITRLNFEDDEGKTYTIYVEATKTTEVSEVSTDVDSDDDYESMGIGDEIRTKLKDIHGTLQAYAYYAIGAFRKVTFAEIEEITLKFGIKISCSTGMPILTQGAAEGSFQVEVKCKFND